MRILLDFPDEFGSDPSRMLDSAENQMSQQRRAVGGNDFGTSGPTEQSFARDQRSSPSVAPTSSPYVPGPFQVSSQGRTPGDENKISELASGGFRPSNMMERDWEDEPVCREPQSVVALTMIGGLALALLAYAFDIR